MIQSRLYSDIKKINGNDLSVRNTYTAGTDKGGVNAGDTFNGVYGLGQMTEDRIRYSSAAVSEVHKLTTEEINSATFALNWTPVVSVKSVSKNVTTGEGESAVTTRVDFDVVQLPAGTEPTGKQVVVTDEGKLKFALGTINDADNNEIMIRYLYNNIVA